MQMGGRGGLVLMAVQAMDGSMVGVHDHHWYRGASWGQWVDVSSAVMASGAQAVMCGENIWPALN